MTPHEWAALLEWAADEVRTSLREGVCDGCDHPTCKRDREEADTISAALRTLAAAMERAEEFGARESEPGVAMVDLPARCMNVGERHLVLTLPQEAP